MGLLPNIKKSLQKMYNFTKTQNYDEKVILEKVKKLIEKEVTKLGKNNVTYRKNTLTLGRLPSDFEISKSFTTYISDGNNNIKEETTNIITNDVVIARNPDSIGTKRIGFITELIYNEWLVPKETWIKNYGRLPNPEKKLLVSINDINVFNDYFEPMKKVATIQAIEITNDIFKQLKQIGLKESPKLNSYLILPVDWSPNGMKFTIGDFLTNQGYTIDKEEMSKTYKKDEKSNIQFNQYNSIEFI